MTIDTNKIHKFLTEATLEETYYMYHSLHFAHELSKFVIHYKLTKKEVCDMFKIPQKKHEAFIKGAFNYTTHHYATLNFYIEKFDREKQ